MINKIWTQGKQVGQISLANTISRHIKGKESKVVDSLSINERKNFIGAISNYKIELGDKLEEGIKMDKEYQNLIKKVTNNEFENV